MNGHGPSFLKCATVLILALLGACKTSSRKDSEELAGQPQRPEVVYDCPAARELVTTWEFLRSKAEFSLAEKGAQEISLAVAGGCHGAAARFIQTAELLLKSGLDGKSSVTLARTMALKNDAEADAFKLIFKRAFLREFLDLDLGASVDLARQLAVEVEGDKAQVEKDFERIVEYCLSERGLNQPKPRCAELATAVGKLAGQFDRSVADAYIEAIEFMRESQGGNLTQIDAMAVALVLVSQSPYAVDNYKNAYTFATKASGLNLERQAAIDFAKQVAAKTKL